MNESPSAVSLRQATHADVPSLQRLIEASVRTLGVRHYTPAQIEASLEHLFGVDRQLIEDGTYVVATVGPTIVGAGGWSRRKTPFGGDQATDVRDAGWRDPAVDPAVIRAFFVHPDWTRCGIGRALLRHCEADAAAEGFTCFELTATLSGHAFYRDAGYRDTDTISIPLIDGLVLEAVAMLKP